VKLRHEYTDNEKKWKEENVQDKVTIEQLQSEVKRMKGIIRELQEAVDGKDHEFEKKMEVQDAVVKKMKGTITDLKDEIERKEDSLAKVDDRITGRTDLLAAELRHVKFEVEQYQEELREEQTQHQALMTRVDTVVSLLRGTKKAPEEVCHWELSREEVHLSQSRLTTGGWGHIVRGSLRGLTVTVKCLHVSFLKPQTNGCLRQHIDTLSKLHHPNIQLFLGAVISGEEEGPLIVSEYLDRSLRATYEEGPMKESTKLSILRDVASALIFLHSFNKPVLHRDVCSTNVLLDNAKSDILWKAKLSFFGSTVLNHISGSRFESIAQHAAPEVTTEDPSRHTAKIDVFSFGVLVCEVSLGRVPPERARFPSMLSEMRRISPSLFPLARDCINHSYQDRPTMKEVLKVLETVV
jgi:serine/threonine protein kinase